MQVRNGEFPGGLSHCQLYLAAISAQAPLTFSRPTVLFQILEFLKRTKGFSSNNNNKHSFFHLLVWSCSFQLKGAVSRYSVIFALFCASKKWPLLAKVSRTSARSAARTASPPQLSRANVVFLKQLSFSAALPVVAIIFPHTEWLSKITDYRDTAALRACLFFLVTGK